MAELSLSPEEQLMSSVGASSAPMEDSFDLTGALQEGYSPAEIADYLGQKRKFDVVGARNEGYTDNQILAHLLGENAFSAGIKQFVQAGGSSIKGILQRLGPDGGMLNTERALAERTAADIASANNPVAGGIGLITGSFADPVALPFGIVKGFQGASTLSTLAKQGSVQGGFAGLLEPVLTPEDSVIKNILFGTVAGAGLGAGIGKLIDRMGAKAADVVDPVKAAEDASLTKQASNAAIEDLSKIIIPEDAPKIERAITGEGVMARVSSDADVQGLINRRAQLQSEVDELRFRQAETTKETPQVTPQIASLLRGETPAPINVADNLPSTSRGLFTPPRAEPSAQVPALLQRPQQPAPEISIERAAQEAALFRDGLDKAIKTRQAEIQNINARLAERKQLLANRDKPELIQVETKKPLDINAPLTPTEIKTIDRLQKVLDDRGFKTLDEAIVATGKPKEVAAAQARIDSGNVQTLEQVVRGFRSGGSAALSPERLYAETTVFPDVERAVVGAVMGEKAPRLGIEPVKNEEVNKLLQDTVGFLGKDLSRMREGGDFSGTLKGTVDAGIAAARKAADEEGSYFGWLFKEDENGNFVNIDKSWNRGEIAAFMPVVRDATRVYNRLMDEAVEINIKGDLSDEALQGIMEKMAYPIQIMGIFQAKRTQASRSLNAFKTLDSSLKEGKTIQGFMKAGIPCA